MPKIHSRYDLPPSPSIDCEGVSLTHQECKRECDINFLVNRYCETGNWGASDGHLPIDSELTNFDGDFQSVMDRLVAAQEEFDSLPAKTRDRFGNDPAKLIQFLNNPDNYAEASMLGLVNERVRDPEPQPAFKPAGVAESGTRVEADKQQ